MKIIRTHRQSLGLLLAAGLLSGCALVDPRGPETLGEIERSAESAIDQSRPQQAPEAPPEEVRSGLLPPIAINVPGVDEAQTEQRFDVKVRRARTRDFFLSLVEGTPYNVIVHPEVDGRVSLSLKNVTVPEAMEAVRRGYGYEYERVGKTYHILPDQLFTRLFDIDYIDMKRTGQSNTSTTPGQVSAGGRRRTDGNQQQGTGSAGTRYASFSSINTESLSEFWPSLQATVEGIVGGGEGRSVSVNPQSGVVIVRAKPAELRAVREFLDATQQVVQRQVVLEARILEVELNDGYESGIKWGELRQPDGDVGLIGLRRGGVTTNSSNIASLANQVGDGLSRNVASSVNSSFSDVFTLGLFTDDFTAFIDLLRTQGSVQVLSNPRVSTVNNQKAVIKVGADEFFVTDVETDTVVGTATSQNTSVEFTPFFSGVSLDVTPQIGADGEITLHVHPTVSEVTEQVKNVSAGGSQLSVPLATSTIRESDSVVRAQSGQVVVIGGLMQNRTRDEESAVPLLGDIPLLGALFRHTAQTTTKSELVILIKPVVVDSPGKWREQIRRSSEGLNELGAAYR